MKKKKKVKIAPEQLKLVRAQKRHKHEVRSVLLGAGFKRIVSVCEKTIEFQNSKSDIDDLFLFENTFIFVEYSVGSDVSTHLKKKYVLYQKINLAQAEFIAHCRGSYAEFPTTENYSDDQCIIRILYCVPGDIKPSLRAELSGMYFFDLVVQKYFLKLAQTIKLSSRNELLAFFGLKYKDVGEGALSPSGVPSDPYHGSVLPEASSSFPPGYKVVSFYVDPEALLARAYVLRSEGWRGTDGAYQRIISKKKIDSIREYLRDQGRVFVNNIVVTLPPSTKVLDAKDDTVAVKSLTKTSPAKILIPREFNSVGIIDGQHRIFSYHEGGKFDEKVAVLRKKQNLLATGVIYPPNVPDAARIKFEAQLFLEINSTQTGAKSDLKQTIALLLSPFSEVSLAKRVVNHMNEHGPLEGEFERFSFEKDKIKTTSIVSYGVRSVIKRHGDDTIYSIWSNADKDKVQNDEAVAELYVKYCAAQINMLLSALKFNLPSERWTTNKKVVGRALSTTVINGMIVCLRRIIEEDRERNVESYKDKLKNVKDFKFSTYKSSQYGSLGRNLFDEFFA